MIIKINKERAPGLLSIDQNLIGIMRFENFKQLNQLKKMGCHILKIKPQDLKSTAWKLKIFIFCLQFKKLNET